jgi:hypothetical protein
MSNVSPAAPANEKKPDAADTCRYRVGIFVYDLVVVSALAIFGVTYARHQDKFSLGDPRLDIAVRAAWFGALGGIVISLKGIYDHSCHGGDWDDGYNLWHIGRPVSGALTGLITLVLLLAVNPTGNVSEPAVYAIAFIFGTQERRFFNFLYEVAALVVRLPNEDQQVEFRAINIQPTEGKQGTIVMITGHGFVKGVSVRIDGGELAVGVVSNDGTTIVGVVPAGDVGARNVTITNPSGERVVLPAKFTYLP